MPDKVIIGPHFDRYIILLNNSEFDFHHDQTLHLIYLINNYSPGRWLVGDKLTKAQSGDEYLPLLSCFREHLDSE